MTTKPSMTRLDTWLWAARLLRTRSLAARAIDGGRVHVNGERAKKGKRIQPGDQVRLRLGPFEFLLTVRAGASRRGPAAEAAALYEEQPESGARREWLRQQHRLAPPAAKPDKRQRHKLRRLKRKEE